VRVSRQAGRIGWGWIFGTANFKSSLNVSVVAPHEVLVGVAPLWQAEGTRANYRSDVLCINSLWSALVRLKSANDLCTSEWRSCMACTAGTKLISRKEHTKLTAFVARVWTAQWRQPFLSACVWGTPFSCCRGCSGYIAENRYYYRRKP
jgi:hypothetical protein